MTTKTDFKITLLENYLFDIFGAMSTDDKGVSTKILKGLLFENINQSTKQHLKRLGSKLTEEQTLFKETLKELKKEFYDEVDEKSVLKSDKTEEELTKKVSELQETIVTIEHYKFLESDFDFKSEHFYYLIELIIGEKGEI